jgi:hypothetical protein
VSFSHLGGVLKLGFTSSFVPISLTAREVHQAKDKGKFTNEINGSTSSQE